MKPKIAIFIHNPVAERACVLGMISALDSKYKITVFTKNECKSSTFKNMHIVAFPGGKGDADGFYKIFKNTRGAVIDYVDNGGRYLGICMGAYWADRHYFNILHNIDSVQYIKRPNSEIKRSFPTISTIRWKRKEHDMFFYDGPTFISKRKQNFNTIARYSNGDPMAIFQKRIGLIGCHPESKRSWYDPAYLRTHWHNYEHHKLLLSFVDELRDR